MLGFGGPDQIATIPTIGPGAVETAKVRLTPAPASGTTATLEVTVGDTAGATGATGATGGNGATYTVTFG